MAESQNLHSDWSAYARRDRKFQEAYDIMGGFAVPSGPDDLRATYDSIKDDKKKSDPPEGVVEHEIRIPLRDGETVTCFVCRPKTQPPGGSPLSVLIHGGGYIAGDRQDEVWTCRLHAQHLGAVAVSIEYRLTPENKFPIPILDTWDVVKWLAKNASNLEADPALGFIVGGNSAGGNLTAVVGWLAKKESLYPPITGLALQVPLISGREGAPEKYRERINSLETGRDAPIMNTAGVEMFIDQYEPDLSSDLYNVYAPMVDLDGYPPTFFQLMGLDPLLDEALVFEEYLRTEKSVPTSLVITPSLPHAFWFLELPCLANENNKCVRDYIQGIKWLHSRANRK